MPLADAVSTTNPVGIRTGRYRGLARAAFVAIAAGCAIGVLVPAGLGWDFANFYDAGHRIVAGQSADLYHQERPIAGRPTQGKMRFWGAPLSAVLFAPLALLRPDIALIAFKLQNVVAFTVALALVFRHCRLFVAANPDRRSAFTAIFLALCVVYQPFWTVFRVGGQSTPTVFLMLVVALFCSMASRRGAAAWILIGAAMIKPSLALMLVFLACVSEVSFVAALVSGLVFLGVLSVAAMGWPLHLEFLHVLVEGSQLARPWRYNSSLYVPLENLRLLALTPQTAPRAALALSVSIWGLKLIVIAMFMALIRRSARHTWPVPARRHFEFMMAVCFWLLVSQTIWEHYLAMLFLPLIYIVCVRHRFPPAGRGLVTAIFVLSLGQNLILMELLWTHFEISSIAALIAIGLFKAGPLLLTLVLLWRHQAALFASYTGAEWVREASSGAALG